MRSKSRKKIKSKMRIKSARRRSGVNLTLPLAPNPLPNLTLHLKSFSFPLQSLRRPNCRWGAVSYLDCRLTEEARDHFAAVVVFDQHVLAALGIGALNGEDHVGCP